jgi:hypothetical protein
MVPGTRLGVLGILLVCAFAASSSRTPTPASTETATPESLVATYGSLADAILAVKHTESSLVASILEQGYRQASAASERAKAALAGGNAAKAKADLEETAALVAQLATEGDNAVAGVRKRLLEGGHHHNAEGEKQGIFDEGFVIVTKEAKKTLLEASRTIASAQDAAALASAWSQVQTTMDSLLKQK